MTIQEQAEKLLDEISTQLRYLIEQKVLAAQVLLEGFIPDYVLESINEEKPLRPIDLERLHSEWKDQIPREPEVKAVLAHLIAKQYALLKEEMPRTWKVLGVDDAAVQAAYQKHYGTPIDAIFTPLTEYERLDSELSKLLIDADLNPLQLYMQRIALKDGEVLFRKGEPSDKVYILTRGKVKVIFDDDESMREVEAFDLIGEMAFLTGAPRTATVKAAGDCDLQYIPTDKLMGMIEHYPEAFKQVFTIASNRYDFIYFLEHIQAFLGDIPIEVVHELFQGSERIHLERGQRLVEKDTTCEGWYLVTNGRLSAQFTEAGSDSAVFERGDSFGEEEMLFNHPHTYSLVAMVDTEVIRISPQSFEDLWNHPAIIRRMFKNVIHKSALTTEDSAPHTTQVIAIGSLGRNAVLSENIARMAGLFGQKRDVLFLDPSTIIELLNLPESALKGSEHLAWLRIRTWYTQTVAAHAYIVFALSPDYPAWNKFCRSNADTLVALADGTHQPARSMEHTWFEPIKAPLPQERWLVLVHPADADIPSGTRRWLDAYAAPRHIHIAGTGEGELLRVMRMVTGTGVGVVLGGGTSKGNAHFGVMRAIAEAGIPVDMICGTSIGSAIAAMFAARYSPEQIAAINQMLLDLNPFRDFAVPRTALLKHRKFEQLAKFSFKDICIEDMWLKYFCISTDLTTAEQIIHEEGETWRATMASGALPMVIPPFIQDSHVLVDGGLLNNVPADVMLQKTQGPVIAINVSPVEDWEVQEEAAPQHRSLMEKVRSPIQLKGNPGIMDVLVQSMVVSSHYKLRSVVNEVDLYLEPPVGHYGMTRFDAWQEMSQIGYEYALPLLTEFKNKHPKLQMI